MEKTIREKLRGMTKDELLQLIEALSCVSDIQQTIKMIVMPSEKMIEREYSSFCRWCASAANHPYSDQSVNQLYERSFLIRLGLDHMTPAFSATILLKMYRELSLYGDYDLDFFYDIGTECREALKEIVTEYGDSISEVQREKIMALVEEYE